MTTNETPTIFDWIEAFKRFKAGDEHALDRFKPQGLPKQG